MIATRWLICSDHAQIVRDEQIGQVAYSSCSSCNKLMICAWIDTSSDDTGSSADDELGTDGERAGNADALALSAAELMRITRMMVLAQTDLMEQLHPLSRFACALASLWISGPFADDIADAHARIERSVGILKNNLHFRRMSRSSRPAAQRFLPWRSLAAGRLDQTENGSTQVDLPQPDSPTKPNVSPWLTVKLTPSTALTLPFCARTNPRRREIFF